MSNQKEGTWKRVGKVGGNPLAPVFRYKEKREKKGERSEAINRLKK